MKTEELNCSLIVNHDFLGLIALLETSNPLWRVYYYFRDTSGPPYMQRPMYSFKQVHRIPFLFVQHLSTLLWNRGVLTISIILFQS